MGFGGWSRDHGKWRRLVTSWSILVLVQYRLLVVPEASHHRPMANLLIKFTKVPPLRIRRRTGRLWIANGNYRPETAGHRTLEPPPPPEFSLVIVRLAVIFRPPPALPGAPASRCLAIGIAFRCLPTTVARHLQILALPILPKLFCT